MWDLYNQAKTSGQHYPEVCTILPSIVLGEIFAVGGDATTPSFTMVRDFFTPDKSYGDNYKPIVDVKDVSLAHYRALERHNLCGERFILSIKETVMESDMPKMFQEVLKENGVTNL